MSYIKIVRCSSVLHCVNLNLTRYVDDDDKGDREELDGDGCRHYGSGDLSVDDGIESVDGICVVVDSPARTVRLYQAVGALHHTTIPALLLHLHINTLISKYVF